MKTYSGSCQCRSIRFEVTSDLAEPGECNCSICARLGLIMISSKPSQFRRLSGSGSETDYQFGKKIKRAYEVRRRYHELRELIRHDLVGEPRV